MWRIKEYLVPIVIVGLLVGGIFVGLLVDIFRDASLEERYPEPELRRMFENSYHTFDPDLSNKCEIDVYTPNGYHYIIDRGFGARNRWCGRDEAIDIMLGMLIRNTYIKTKRDLEYVKDVLEKTPSNMLRLYVTGISGSPIVISSDIKEVRESEERIANNPICGSIALRGKKWIEDNLDTH